MGTYSSLLSTGFVRAPSRAKSLRNCLEHSIRHFPYSAADSKYRSAWIGSAVMVGEEGGGPVADVVASFEFSSDIERLPCRTFSLKYELRIKPAISEVRMRVIKN